MHSKIIEYLSIAFQPKLMRRGGNPVSINASIVVWECNSTAKLKSHLFWDYSTLGALYVYDLLKRTSSKVSFKRESNVCAVDLVAV